MSSEARWWYILGEDQQHVGPYAASKLKEHFSSGYITESTLVWAEGQSEWQQLSLVPGLISDIPEQVFSSAVIAADDERPSFLPDGEEELTDDDKTVYKWDESIRAWVPQSMNGQYLCNHQITGSYAYYKKDTKGERHGTPAERTLASSNPMAVPPPQVSTVPAIRPPPPPAHLYQPMQMAVPPPPQCQQQQMDQLKVPPPQRLQQFRPPYNMPQMMNRPPPPPAGMAGQQMWRLPPPQQQMAGGHGHPPMMQMSMAPPPPPQG